MTRAKPLRVGRADISDVLSHLIRLKGQNFSPKDTLIQILNDGKLIASQSSGIAIKWDPQFGNNSGDSKTLYRFPSICFTETPVHELGTLIKNTRETNHKYSTYGLGFMLRDIYKAGGGPCFYIRKDDPTRLAKDLGDVCNFLFESNTPRNIKEAVSRLTAFGNSYSPELDFYWEREWRILNDFLFFNARLQRIFVYAPESDFLNISSKITKQYSNLHFIDLDWNL